MYKSMLLSLVAVSFLLCPLAYCKEGVLIGTPDPAVIADGDNSFYIFATGKGLPIYHSTDLVNWDRAGQVFDEPVPGWAKELIRGTQGIWAPDIVQLNDRYYVYYSISTFGSQRSAIGVAVNTTLDHTSPDYKWVDQGPVIESWPGKCDFNAIDPAIYQQEDGQAIMFWGSYWGGIKAIELDPDTGKPLKSDPEILTIAARPNHAVEAAYVVKNDGLYYMFVSWNSCCDGAESTYKVMVGRSENLLGPYLDFDGKLMTQGGGTLVLSNNDNWRGPGHNSVLTTDNGSWLVHHTYDTFHLENQRILQIRPLYWTASGWPVAGEPLSPKNPMTTEKANVVEDELVGSWRFTKDYGPEKIIDLLPGGRIANYQNATWKLENSHIYISWNESSSEVDPVLYFIESRKDSFIGRDETGAVVRGKQLTR